ncbi:sugar porter family MFS transporter [Verrucomicrobiota bacterium]
MEEKSSKLNLGYLMFLTFSAAMGGLLFGYDLLVISGAMQFYELYFGLGDSGLLQGWAVSSCVVGCMIGAFGLGVCKAADKYGRVRLLILSALFFLVSAIGSGLAPTFTQFVLYRILGGIGMGMASTISPMYIAEIAPAKLRGRFVAVNQLTIVIGILLAQFVNYLIANSHPVADGLASEALLQTWNGQTGWKLMFIAEAVPAFIFIVCMFFVPYSPRWLVKKSRDEEARKILERIGGDAHAKETLLDIEGTLDEEHKQAGFSELLKPQILRIVIMGVIIAVFQQWCGINVIFTYASDIFRDAGYEVSGVMFNLVIIGLTNLTFTFVGMAAVDRLGRKLLMIIGSAGLLVTYVLLGFCFFAEIQGWYVFVLALTAIAFFAATLGPVAWILISEIFPNSVRGIAVSIAVLSLWAANFVLNQTFPMLKAALGPSYTFWIYAVICFLGILYIKKYIPETKGKSLEQIEKELSRT